MINASAIAAAYGPSSLWHVSEQESQARFEGFLRSIGGKPFRGVLRHQSTCLFFRAAVALVIVARPSRCRTNQRRACLHDCPKHTARFRVGALRVRKIAKSVFTARVCKIIHRAAIRQRRHQRRKFQRRNLNAFAENGLPQRRRASAVQASRCRPALQECCSQRARPDQALWRKREPLSHPMRTTSDSKNICSSAPSLTVKFILPARRKLLLTNPA